MAKVDRDETSTHNALRRCFSPCFVHARSSRAPGSAVSLAVHRLRCWPAARHCSSNSATIKVALTRSSPAGGRTCWSYTTFRRRPTIERWCTNGPSRSCGVLRRSGAPSRIRTCTALGLNELPPADWAIGANCNVGPPSPRGLRRGSLRGAPARTGLPSRSARSAAKAGARTTESNLGPSAYRAAALPTELCGQNGQKAAAPLPHRATAIARQWRATGAAPLAKSGRSRCQTASSGARGGRARRERRGRVTRSRAHGRASRDAGDRARIHAPWHRCALDRSVEWLAVVLRAIAVPPACRRRVSARRRLFRLS